MSYDVRESGIEVFSSTIGLMDRIRSKDEFDGEERMVALIDKLQDTFGDRLRFVGIQGSRARGEAREGSDIDTVVVFDDLGVSDLAKFRAVAASMPHSGIACGFIGSVDILSNWSRYDVFNLVMDTRPLFGSLSSFFNTDFTSEDALVAAKAGSCEIYHALGHTIVFESDNLSQVLMGCIKLSFFIMRALEFAKTGEYPSSRSRMKEIASQSELKLLEAYDSMEDCDINLLSYDLFEWVSHIIESNTNCETISEDDQTKNHAREEDVDEVLEDVFQVKEFDSCGRERFVSELLIVWRASVEATYTFLKESDIDRIAEYVPKAILRMPRFYIAFNQRNEPIEFLGVDGNVVEMIFLDSSERGKGLGKQLMCVAVRECGVRKLDVN